MPSRFAPAAASLAIAGSLAACSVAMEEDRSAPNVPPGNVIGEAESCLPTNSIQNTRVYGDETIDFEVGGDTVYRNVLPNRCYSLGFEQRFGYQTSTGQLCSFDSITVLHADGSRGATCRLGEFLPIELTD